jgi:ABC-type Na+ efflux pump permease subunit
MSLYLTFSFMGINIWDFFTLRALIMAILVLPLLTMLVFLPFFYSLTKDRQETLGMIGFLGFFANIVLCVECGYRVIWQFSAILFFNNNNPFEFKYLVFGLITLGIAVFSYRLSVKFYSLVKDTNNEPGITALNLDK